LSIYKKTHCAVKYNVILSTFRGNGKTFELQNKEQLKMLTQWEKSICGKLIHCCGRISFDRYCTYKNVHEDSL